MDTIPAVFLVFGAAFAWLGLTFFVIHHFRRRRGSSLVATAPPAPDSDDNRRHRPWRRVRPLAGRAPARRRRLSVRKVRG
ncbi:hypothetical protein [Pseudarthrobacter sp. NS4]|uniref:hypothetical protein n=1 Tax=Pseudarthrobacter sp. NS4 TaxID=2973976 RepID=UPI002162DDEA|nr:hypothetical protein [Pseudarthrobacter sp. NS4]